MSNKKILSADETMLLLICKNWIYKNVLPKNKQETGTYSYVQRCCNFRCNSEKADVFTILFNLCEKLLSVYEAMQIIKRIHDEIFWHSYYGFDGHPIEQTHFINALISALAAIRVTDLKLDDSLILK